MTDVQPFLAHIWFAIVGFMLAIYVILDGFDLGVGVLSLFAKHESRHTVMLASLGSIWDANATWLIVLAGALFGAFPLVFSVVLHAMYVPLMLMIFGLIFRAVAFEFREQAGQKRGWTLAFGVGSLLAAFAQGLVLGGYLSGIRVENGIFAGSTWDWLNPFSVLVAAGVVAGYSLLGATYLIIKTTADIQQASYRYAQRCAVLTLLAGIVVTLWTPVLYPYIRDKWFSLPQFYYLALLPAFASFAMLMLWRALRRRFEHAPFVWSLVIFITSFTGLAVSIFPNIVPPGISISAAAASPKTLIFMLVGIGMLIPIIIVYNGYQYLVFKGKVTGHYGDG
jgi:cytochrome bd ubiquinol oxidase subunit II